MDEARAQNVLVVEQQMQHGVSHEVAGGTAVIFSAPRPGDGAVNEDVAGLFRLGPGHGVLVVADGAGGQRAGARASQLALTAVGDALRHASAEDVRASILVGFDRANEAVADLGIGAGTTLAVAEICDAVVQTYHVGDSQIVLTGQRGKVKFQTVSHSPVGYAVEAGVLDESEAIHHEDRHLVSNLVGDPQMRIEVGPPLPLATFDTLVLGSDGLFDNLHVSEIVDRVRKGPMQKAASDLVDECTARMTGASDELAGKPDDLTFIVFRLAAATRAGG